MNTMSDVVMYSTEYCPYCVRAKMLLEQKNVEFTDIRIDIDMDRRGEMQQRSGRTSVPQIFIGDYHVGGCDDLFALEQQGELDNKLGLTGA